MKTATLLLFIIVTVFSAFAHAKTWGPSKAGHKDFNRSANLDILYEKLSKSKNSKVSKLIFHELWLVWMTAPNESAAEEMNQALRARGGYNFNKALRILDKLIEKQPRFAQALNERSYIYFLKKDYNRSLSECEKVLELDPRHLGCLTGMARILIRHQRRYKVGKALLERAIKWHPHIYEKVLLREIPVTDL